MTAKCYNCLDINFKSTSTHLDLINKNDGIIVDSGQKIHTKQYLNETIIFIQQNSSSKIITIQHKIFKSQFVVLFLIREHACREGGLGFRFVYCSMSFK